MSLTLLQLDERLCRLTGDWVQAKVTTAIAASTSIVSTALSNYDHGQNDFFNNHWVYIEDYANLGTERLIYDYVTATGTASVRGANLTTDNANLATVRIARSRWDDRKQALNDTFRECYKQIFNSLDDRTLVSGNVLPNPSFEDWAATTIPDFWTASATATVAENTTAGLHRQGTSSAKLTAGAASDYFYISSNNYERLLDLRDTTVSLKACVYPEVANDAYIQIYTIKADGTAQTLTSTTACPAAKWTLLELEDQAINDDIVEIQIRLGVTTNSKYAYFDDVRLTGKTIYEYLLPADFQIGKLSRVEMQMSSNSDDACDDIASDAAFAPVWGWDIQQNGAYKYLRMPYCWRDKRIRLVGYAPFSTLTAGTSTVNISDGQANLICEYAAYLLYSRMSGPMSSDDSARYYQKAQEHLMKWNSLSPTLRMTKPVGQVHVTPL